MGKKRKAPVAQLPQPKALDPKDGNLGPIRNYEDVADAEDEFHMQRDQILLDDGPDTKRRKHWAEEGMICLTV
jgi:U3 small nucleolar RNA-associated protein 3